MAFKQIKSISPTQLTDAGIGSTSGPLSTLDLTSSNFNYNLYRYPINSVNPLTNDLGHEMIFYINIPTNSYWNNGSSSNQVDAVVNRSSNATRYGLRSNDNASNVIGNATASLQDLVMSQKTTRTTAAISLYVPNTMVFAQNMHYETVSMNQSIGPLSDATAFINGVAEAKWKVAASAAMSIAPDAIEMITGTKNKLQTVSGLQENFLQALGLADNPQNYLFFKFIDFRTFYFEFVLTPENQNESQIIKQIAYLFRFHSAPEVASGSVGRFFVPPSTFDIDLLHNGKRNMNVPRISSCVLMNVSLDYAGAGSWATTYDGAPRQVKLGLTFKETEIMTKDRVEQGF